MILQPAFGDRPPPGGSFLSPDAQKIYNRITEGKGRYATAAPDTDAGAAPSTPQQSDQKLPKDMVKQIGTLKGRPVYLGADGKRHVDIGEQ